MYFNKKDSELPLLSTEEFLEGLRKEYPLTFITEVKESPKPVKKIVEKKEKEEDLYKKRIEDAILEKINFTNIPEGYYTNLPISPGIEVLKKLGSKKKKILNVPIPLTILYNKGDVQWISNDHDGAIVVKEAPSDWKTKFIEKCTAHKLLDFDFDSTPIAIVKIPEFTNPTSYDTRPLILSELKKMLDDNIESFIVQKYIQSKGNKSSLYRVLWRASRNTYAYNCSNKAKYKDKELKQKQKEWKAKKDNSSKDERSKLWWEYEQILNKYYCVKIRDVKTYDYVRIFGESIDEIEAWSYCIIHHLEDVTVPGMKFRFETFGTDWIKDNNNNWWFIGIKAFELQKQTFDALKKWKEDLEKCLQSNGEFAEIRGLPELKMDKLQQQLTLKEMDESLSVGKICGLCKYRYLLWEEKEFVAKHNKPLWYNLTNKMIADLILYLHLRGIDAECFHLFPVVNEINKYMSVSICHLCYNLYQSAQKLIQTSFVYKDCLVPPQTVNDLPSNKFELLKREKIPDNSTYHRIFIAFYYFTVLNDSIPVVEAKDSYGEIRYNFGTRTYNIPFDLSKWNESYCPIKQFRVHNFLSNTEGLINYLTTNIPLTIFLGSNKKNLIERTKCVVNLDKFTVGGKKQISTDLVDYDLTLLIEDLPPFIMKLSVGIIEDPELLIGPDYEFYADMYEERNIFFPPTEFTDCHPIPQEWYFTLDNFKFEVFQNNIKQQQLNQNRRRSSTISHTSTIKALRKKVAEEKDVAQKHEILLDKIFKRFCTIKIDYNLLSDYIHKLFRYNDKDIETDYLDSKTVLTAFRSYSHFDYTDLPLITALLAIADFIDYYSDVYDKWKRNDFKCIIYHMLKGDIYETITAMPLKHHQKHRFDNYLYLYQFADPQLNNCADVSELRSIMTNIHYYVKDESSPLILYSKWILQSEYYQNKCKEYDAFGKGTILFPEFCIVCEQTFRYLSLDENNYHTGNCSKHGSNCKINSLVNICIKCLTSSNQSSLNLLEKNKGNFLTTLLNKPTPAIPKNDVIERISLSSWNTPRTNESDSVYSSGSEADICDDIEFYVNSIHQGDSVTKDSLMMLEENMNSRRVYSRTQSKNSDISDISDNTNVNNNEDGDLRRSIQRKLSPTQLQRKAKNKRSISPVVSPNKSKRKPQSAQLRSHPLYPHVKTHMRPASSSPDINQSTVKPSEIADNSEKPPLYNSNNNNRSPSKSPLANKKRRIHSAKSSNIVLKKKLIRRPQSSAPVLTNRNDLHELLKDVTDSVERLHRNNAAEKYETGRISRIRSANHNLYTLPEKYQPTEAEKDLEFTEEIVLEHNSNNNNNNNNINPPIISQSAPCLQTIRIEYDQPIHNNKKKRYKNKKPIPTPTKSPNMNTKLIWRARENRKIFQHLIDRSDSKQQIKLKTMEKTMLIYVKYGKIDKVEELLREGVSPDTKDSESPCRSLLHIAVRQASLELVELLLQYGANPNIEDELGCTPSSEAIIQKQYHIYQCLNKAGGK